MQRWDGTHQMPVEEGARACRDGILPGLSSRQRCEIPHKSTAHSKLELVIAYFSGCWWLIGPRAVRISHERSTLRVQFETPKRSGEYSRDRLRSVYAGPGWCCRCAELCRGLAGARQIWWESTGDQFRPQPPLDHLLALLPRR